MVSGPGGRDHDSQNQLFLILEVPRYFKASKKKPKSCVESIISGNLRISKLGVFEKVCNSENFDFDFLFFETLKLVFSQVRDFPNPQDTDSHP